MSGENGSGLLIGVILFLVALFSTLFPEENQEQ